MNQVIGATPTMTGDDDGHDVVDDDDDGNDDSLRDRSSCTSDTASHTGYDIKKFGLRQR